MTQIDPFASAPTAEANTALSDPTFNTPVTPTTTSKETTVSDSTTATTSAAQTPNEVTTTLKGGGGFDAPWTVLRAASPEAMLQLLQSPAMKELLEMTQKVGDAFVEMAPEGKKSAPAARPAAAAPTGVAQAPNGETPPEGYVFKSGISKKNGKPWQAFMPIDRNSGLQTIWL